VKNAMAGWTLEDIAWTEFRADRVDPDLLAVAKAAAMVEHNGADYAVYLNNVFADDPAIKPAIDAWALEEVQHGKALARWARMADPAWDFDAAVARFKAGYSLPLDATASVRGSRTGELIARCIVETGTSSYYSALAEASDEPVFAEICRRIAADEFRHYKLFYEHMRRYLQRERIGAVGRARIGLGRLLEAGDDAQEILIRIQERLPGSELAEKAGMELADYYFRIRDMPLAADAYDLFVQNYPRSRQVTKARLRLIYAYYAQFKGPEFEGKGLEEASARLRGLQADEPAVAQKIGSDALLVRIYESEAARLRSQAEWYMRVNDWIAAELTIRALVKRYPNSIAAIEALREIPTVLDRLPAAVVKQAPDYAALRKAIVGVDAGPEPAGIPAAREAPLPGAPQIQPQRPVEGAVEPDPQAPQGPGGPAPGRST